MTSVGQLMTLYPDLAVIFLVRDPRGFFWSRMKVFGQPKLQTLPHFAQEMCRGRMLKDVRAITELFLKAPHRVRFLRYEDLALRPVEVSRNIYRFADLAWTDGIQSAIINQTYSRGGHHHDNNNSVTAAKLRPRRGRRGRYPAYSLTRPDSYLAATAWRASVPWEVSVAVEEACGAVMDLLGYSPFSAARDLRNLTLPNRGRFKAVHMLGSSQPADLGEVAAKDLGEVAAKEVEGLRSRDPRLTIRNG